MPERRASGQQLDGGCPQSFGDPQGGTPFRPVSWAALTSSSLIPGCSTCGQSVDWLRSCYSSKWALFRDSPNTLVRGRYYFSPPGTPFYTNPTNLGSRVW